MLIRPTRLVCLLGTILVGYKNRSEFVSWWSFPLSLLLYTPALVFWAIVDFYAQVGQLVSSPSYAIETLSTIANDNNYRSTCAVEF